MLLRIMQPVSNHLDNRFDIPSHFTFLNAQKAYPQFFKFLLTTEIMRKDVFMRCVLPSTSTASIRSWQKKSTM